MKTLEEYLIDYPESTEDDYNLYVIDFLRKEDFRKRLSVLSLRFCAAKCDEGKDANDPSLLNVPELSELLNDIVENNRVEDLEALEAAAVAIAIEKEELKLIKEDIKNNKDKIKTMKLEELADLVFKLVEHLGL